MDKTIPEKVKDQEAENRKYVAGPSGEQAVVDP